MYINFSNYKIDSYDFNEHGSFVISYEKAGKEMDLLLLPEEAAEMFKKVNLIDDYEMYKNAPVILWEEQQPFIDYHGNFHRRTGKAEMQWTDFVIDVKSWESYNALTMQHIVELHESSKVLNQFIGFIESIGGKVSLNP